MLYYNIPLKILPSWLPLCYSLTDSSESYPFLHLISYSVLKWDVQHHHVCWLLTGCWQADLYSISIQSDLYSTDPFVVFGDFYKFIQKNSAHTAVDEQQQLAMNTQTKFERHEKQCLWEVLLGLTQKFSFLNINMWFQILTIMAKIALLTLR